MKARGAQSAGQREMMCAAATILSLMILLLPGSLFAGGSVPRIEGGGLVLPRDGISRFYCSYWVEVDSLDGDRLGCLLQLATAGRVVGLPGDGASGDCAGPRAVINWTSGHEVVFMPSVLSDSVGVMVETPGKEGVWNTIIAPGLRDSIAAVVHNRPFACRGTGSIRRIEFKNRSGTFKLKGGKDLDSLALFLGRAKPTMPTACPFWNLVRLETERGIVFGALAADDCATIVLSPENPWLEKVWRKTDLEMLGGGIVFAGTEYDIPRAAVALLERLAKAHKVDLHPDSDGRGRN